MPTSPMKSVIESLRQVALRDIEILGDGELLGSFIERHDEAALAVLIQRHGPMVWGVCRRLLSHHDAEDAFQATFLVLVRKAASIVPRAMVGNWLYGVAHQTALQARRTAARRNTREVQMMMMPDAEALQNDPWRDLQPVLDEELSRLPDIYRAVIVLCDLAGNTRNEVARQLGCPEGTVAGRLARARTLLAKRLTQRGVTWSGGAMAAVLAQQAASAGVPPSVVSSTIKAASLFAAGQAAGTGVISVKVAGLTEGVLKTMLISKLKTATAMVLVVAALVTGASLFYQTQAAESPIAQQPRDEPKAERKEKNVDGDKDKLQGTWRLVTTEFDGVKIGEGRPEIKDSRLVIERLSFTLTTKLFHSPNVPLDPEDVKVIGTLALDAKRSPKEITLTWEKDPWTNIKDYTRRGIYVLDRDSLKICLSLDQEAKALPTEFSANVGSKRSLLIFRHDPAPKKVGDKKP